MVGSLHHEKSLGFISNPDDNDTYNVYQDTDPDQDTRHDHNSNNLTDEMLQTDGRRDRRDRLV